MSEPYVGEIRLAGFNFAPQGWAFCNGQILSISQFDVLFNLIGTTYGGDGVSTFALPNLQSRAAIHQGPSFVIGQAAGTENVTININQIPSHSHPIAAQTAEGSSSSPQGAIFAESSEAQYASTSNSVSAPILSTNGGNQPHDNLMPYLCTNYIISLFGIYPSQN